MNQSRDVAPFIRNLVKNQPRTKIDGETLFYVYEVKSYDSKEHLYKILKSNSLNIIKIIESDPLEIRADVLDFKEQFALYPSELSLKDRVVAVHKNISIVINGRFEIGKKFYILSETKATQDNIQEIDFFIIENVMYDTYTNTKISQLNLSSFKQLKGLKSVQFYFILNGESVDKEIESIEVISPYETLFSKISGKSGKNDIEFIAEDTNPLWVIPQNVDDYKLTIYSPWLDNSKIYLPDWIRFDDYTNGFFNEEIFGDYVKCSPYRTVNGVAHRPGNYFNPNQLKLNKYYSTLLFMICFAWIYYGGFPNVNSTLKDGSNKGQNQSIIIKSRVDEELQGILKDNSNISQASDSYINRYIKNGFTEELKYNNEFFAYVNMLGGFLYSEYNYFGGGSPLNKILNPFYYNINDSSIDHLCYFLIKDNYVSGEKEDDQWADFDDATTGTGGLIVSNNFEDTALHPLKSFDIFWFQDSSGIEAIEAPINNFSLLWVMTPLNVASIIVREGVNFALKGYANQKGSMSNEISLRLESNYYENSTKTIKLFYSKFEGGIIPNNVKLYTYLDVEKFDKSDFIQGETLNIRVAFNLLQVDSNDTRNNNYNIDTDKLLWTFNFQTAVNLQPSSTQSYKNKAGNVLRIIMDYFKEKWRMSFYINDKENKDTAFVGVSMFECYINDETMVLKDKYKNISQSVPIETAGQNWTWTNLPNPITVNENLNTTPNNFKLTPSTLQGLMYFKTTTSPKNIYKNLDTPFFTRYSWKNKKGRINNIEDTSKIPTTDNLILKPTTSFKTIDELYFNGIYGGQTSIKIKYKESNIVEVINLTLFDEVDETISQTTIRF